MLPAETWFARVAVVGGAGILFATNELPESWHQRAIRLMPPGAELSEYIDRSRGLVRIAAFCSGRLDGCIFVGPTQAPPQWEVVRSLFEAEAIAEHDRRVVLSGRGGNGMAETGPVVCACFGVGLAAIRDAVAKGEAVTVADVGRLLRAGTNCGSCVPELRGIIERSAEKV
jgi:assimilatory nitrate reductase catalytic subunit